MPLPNIILRHRWSEILPHKSLALSQFVKKIILVAGVSATTDSQSLLADEHRVTGGVHSSASSILLCTAGRVAASPCTLPDTLGTLHSWHIIRSSVQANHCFFRERSSYRSCSEHSSSTHMTTNIWQQTDIGVGGTQVHPVVHFSVASLPLLYFLHFVCNFLFLLLWNFLTDVLWLILSGLNSSADLSLIMSPHEEITQSKE